MDQHPATPARRPRDRLNRVGDRKQLAATPNTRTATEATRAASSTCSACVAAPHRARRRDGKERPYRRIFVPAAGADRTDHAPYNAQPRRRLGAPSNAGTKSPAASLLSGSTVRVPTLLTGLEQIDVPQRVSRKPRARRSLRSRPDFLRRQAVETSRTVSRPRQPLRRALGRHRRRTSSSRARLGCRARVSGARRTRLRSSRR
jgi:hypothetical protein